MHFLVSLLTTYIGYQQISGILESAHCYKMQLSYTISIASHF